jgi:molybdopterin-guanine dinucleotide biosynthesis protein A
MSGTNWTGVVLAGGRSSRMGRDKALVAIGTTTLLQRSVDLLRPHVNEILVIGDPSKYRVTHATVIADDDPGKGPLGGLVTGLRRAGHDHLMVVACDMPGLNDRFIQHMQLGPTGESDAVVPEHNGHLEPLAACYHRRCLGPFEACISQGRLKMSDALKSVRTRYLSIRPGTDEWADDLFRNVNNPADL